jgi:hypothetical protein
MKAWNYTECKISGKRVKCEKNDNQSMQLAFRNKSVCLLKTVIEVWVESWCEIVYAYIEKANIQCSDGSEIISAKSAIKWCS